MQQEKYNGTTNNMIGALILGVFLGAISYLAFRGVELSLLIGFASFTIIGVIFRIVELLEEIRNNLVELNKKKNKQ